MEKKDIYRGNKTSFKKGHVSFNKGKPRSEETKRKISESHKGIRPSDETRRKLSKAHMGIVTWNKGLHPDYMQKENHPMFGKHHTEETRRKISLATKGKKMSEEFKRKISEIMGGDKHWNWQGGKSFEPYSVSWTETLKRAIRERDHYSCQLCGKFQGDIAFDIHHINYDKKNCNPENLITLCRRCHNKTNINRNYWISYFKNRVGIQP
jgi:hypothetical protein